MTNAVRHRLIAVALLGLAAGCGKPEPVATPAPAPASELASALAPAAVSEAPAEQAQVELLADVRAIQPGDSFTVGIRIRLEPGWHTYWKNPGDVGVPIAVTWTLPPGCTADALQWPVPVRIEEEGLVTFGYEQEVLLLAPIRTTAELPSGELKISAAVAWLVCKEACLPREGTVALALRAGETREAADAATQAAIAETRARFPVAGVDWTFKATATDSEIAMDIAPPAGVTPTLRDFFPEARGLIDLAQAPAWTAGPAGGTRLTLKRAPGEALPEAFRGVLLAEAPDAVAIDVHAIWVTP